MDGTQEILNTLEGTVDRLKVVFAEGGEIPLNDNTAEVRQLCISVEEVLRHNQKEKVSFWGDRRDYWHYLSEVVSKMKTLDGCVRRVQGLPQLTTGQGRGRALIRECLTEQLLADCIQNSLSNLKRTKEWYHPTSILLTNALSQRVLNALYDLSDVTFDLSSGGVDLDETWPCFALKSFDYQNGPSESQNQTTSSPLFKVLGSTQVAKVANKDRPKVSLLERAVEEEPTEIFVRQEIPFNLELVGSLLNNIRDSLTSPSSHSGHSLFQTKPLPELRVANMDDITSCLSLLKEYITSWSHDLVKKGSKLIEENKELKDKQVDLELQLQDTMQESENSETDLIKQLQSTREEAETFSSESSRLLRENEQLTFELSQTREKLKELEVMNFDLEEQLVRCGAEKEESGRDRSYTVMESSLQEKDQELIDISQRLESLETHNQQLQLDLNDARTSLQNQSVVHEVHRRSEEDLKQFQSEISALEERESVLKIQCSELHSQNQSLTKDLDELRVKMEWKLEEKLKLESNKLISVEQERDRMKAELEEMNSLVENQKASLKFKLSSQNIELQQVKEHCSKKDRCIAELRNQIKNLQGQVGEMEERCQSSEKQVEELKCELQDVESVLHNNHEEMSSLQEQLTKKTLSRDQDRASMLKMQTQWDSTQQQLVAENTELKRRAEILNTENEDIRKAFTKLLEQKVTLWQHADDLEQEQISMAMWLDSKKITECMSCNMTFTVFARKHHCRSCGKVFCTKCCDSKIQLAVSKDPARVCENCYNRIIKKRTPLASAVINTPLDLTISSGLSSQLTASQKGSTNSLNIERTVDLNGNSLQAKLCVQNQLSDLDNSENQSHSSSLERNENSSLEDTFSASSKIISDLSPEDMTDIKPSSYHSIGSMEYSVKPEVKQREAERGRLSQMEPSVCSISDIDYRITSIPGETLDEGYCLIDAESKGESFPIGLDDPGSISLDVSALASKLAKLEDNGDEQGQKTRTNSSRTLSIGSGKIDGLDFTEVSMEGGGLHKVPVRVEKCGTTIAWEFSTEPKGIAFGIWYKETRESTKEDEVLPLKRCVSHKAVLNGEYCAQKTGIYIVRFDNCHSKYSGRKLLYKVWTRSPT